MCGRFSLTLGPREIAKHFGVELPLESWRPRYNIAPQQRSPVIMNTDPGKVVQMQWGLIPSWATAEGKGQINAKAETLLEKPTFKEPFLKTRCLVLADSFYEWKHVEGKKLPYRILRKDKQPFAFAGLFAVWNGEPRYAIITTQANLVVKPIHDRMPVILRPEHERKWLEIGIADVLEGYMKPYPPELMTAYRISADVNNPRHEDPGIIQPVKTLADY